MNRRRRETILCPLWARDAGEGWRNHLIRPVILSSLPPSLPPAPPPRLIHRGGSGRGVTDLHSKMPVTPRSPHQRKNNNNTPAHTVKGNQSCLDMDHSTHKKHLAVPGPAQAASHTPQYLIIITHTISQFLVKSLTTTRIEGVRPTRGARHKGGEDPAACPEGCGDRGRT